MSDYYTLRPSSSLSIEAKETLSKLYYDNKISQFAKEYFLTPKKTPTSIDTSKIEYDLEKKMRSSNLTPSTREKMNVVFHQLFQKKKETPAKVNRVINNDNKPTRTIAMKELTLLLQKDSKTERRKENHNILCLTDSNRISLMRRGINKELAKSMNLNKPIVSLKRNVKDELKSKEFFKTFFKSEISKRNKQQLTEDQFYHNTVNEGIISNKIAKGYDKVVGVMKSRMMLYGVSMSKN